MLLKKRVGQKGKKRANNVWKGKKAGKRRGRRGGVATGEKSGEKYSGHVNDE